MRAAHITRTPTIRAPAPFTWAPATSILAIDTDRDEIKRVIPMAPIYNFTPSNPNGLAFHPGDNRLYFDTGDGALVGAYDLSTNQFLSATHLDKGLHAGVAVDQR